MFWADKHIVLYIHTYTVPIKQIKTHSHVSAVKKDALHAIAKSLFVVEDKGTSYPCCRYHTFNFNPLFD